MHAPIGGGLDPARTIGGLEAQPPTSNASSSPVLTALLSQVRVAGKTLGQWSAEWWKWAYSFSAGNDPFTDTASPSANQSGPVFFLAGNAGGTSERTFSVPAGKWIMVPLLVAELSQAELGDFNLTAAQVANTVKTEITDKVDSLHARINGVNLPQSLLFNSRLVSPAFHFNAAPGNLFASIVGDSGIAVADGYWLMLPPLPGGTLNLNFGGGVSEFGFSIDVTDHITIGQARGASSTGTTPGDTSDISPFNDDHSIADALDGLASGEPIVAA
jgi:hypothetical protein